MAPVLAGAAALAATGGIANSQEVTTPAEMAEPMDGASATASGPEGIPDQVGELVGAAGEKLNALGSTPEALTASESVLQWIDTVSSVYHPWVNWLLVAVGISLFVSHLGQLVLGKLWVAVRHQGWNWGEVLNDLLVCLFAGLALPAVLVIPVGYTAFIANPVAVLTASGAGVLFGVYLYMHGMRQESLAQKGKENGESRDDGKRVGFTQHTVIILTGGGKGRIKESRKKRTGQTQWKGKRVRRIVNVPTPPWCQHFHR